MLTILMGAKEIVLYVCVLVVGLVFLTGIILLGIYKNNLYSDAKKVRKMKATYVETHKNLFEKNKDHLKRLNTMAETNLLYASMYEEFAKRYTNLSKKKDLAAKMVVEQLIITQKEANHRSFKKCLKENKPVFDLYIDQVNELTEELEEQFKAEDKLRLQLSQLTEKFDVLKNEFCKYEDQLDILSDTFFRVFDGIESSFDEINKKIEGAYYEDAINNMPTLSKMIEELEKAIYDFPGLCVDLKETLPRMIDTLEAKYEKMKADNIPVHHLHVGASINQYRSEVKDLLHRLSNFESKGIRSYITQMEKEISEYDVAFQQEYDSAVLVESDCEEVYTDCNNIEKQFINLRQRLIKVVEVYKIDANFDGYVDKIQLRVDQLGGTKRQLDTYIHSSTKQPYSMLVEKMRELSVECNDVNTMIHNFNKYMDSLKVDADNAYKLINETYIAMKHCEYLLRELNVESISAKYQSIIDHVYEILDKMYVVIMATPIDVNSVNGFANDIKGTTDSLINQINNEMQLSMNAEKNILIANKERADVQDFNKILLRCESLFHDGDFNKANVEALAIIKKVKAE